MVAFRALTTALIAAILTTNITALPLAPTASPAIDLKAPATAGTSVSDKPGRNATHHTYEWAKFHVSSVTNMTGNFARSLEKRTTGDIEVHWQFADQEQVCGDFGAVCFTPWAYMWVDWYANGASNPTCSDGFDLTVASTSNHLNGQIYYSSNCNIWAIFDSNNSGGTVETFSSGHGANCGWVDSYDHTSYGGGLVYTEDYYHHCTW